MVKNVYFLYIQPVLSEDVTLQHTRHHHTSRTSHKSCEPLHSSTCLPEVPVLTCSDCYVKLRRISSCLACYFRHRGRQVKEKTGTRLLNYNRHHHWQCLGACIPVWCEALGRKCGERGSCGEFNISVERKVDRRTSYFFLLFFVLLPSVIPFSTGTRFLFLTFILLFT